jgi:hypothetical protein
MTFFTHRQRDPAARTNHRDCPAPACLPAFPDAVRTPEDDRIRWRDPEGVVYEWDSQDGALNMYGVHGWHLGEYDHVHGANLKLAEPGRKLRP